VGRDERERCLISHSGPLSMGWLLSVLSLAVTAVANDEHACPGTLQANPCESKSVQAAPTRRSASVHDQTFYDFCRDCGRASQSWADMRSAGSLTLAHGMHNLRQAGQ
jgi:hypothetical protein